MSLIFATHEIQFTFDTEEEANSVYETLEAHVKDLQIRHVRANNQAEVWIVHSSVMYNSTVEEVDALAATFRGIGNVDQEARDAFDKRESEMNS